jgi:hypothetical protein
MSHFDGLAKARFAKRFFAVEVRISSAQADADASASSNAAGDLA